MSEQEGINLKVLGKELSVKLQGYLAKRAQANAANEQLTNTINSSVEDFNFDNPKTKEFTAVMKNLHQERWDLPYR